MGRLKCDAAWLFKYIYETKITKKWRRGTQKGQKPENNQTKIKGEERNNTHNFQSFE